MIITDQIGHQIELAATPKRIISLVPSQTELLYDLGLEDEVIGITKFCIHPNDWFKSKIRVGGTKTVNLEKVATLKPDLIIANKEENTESEIRELQKIYPVYTSDIANLKGSMEMILQLGEIVNKVNESTRIVKKIEHEFQRLVPFSDEKKNVLYLIWKDPYMSINQNTFINDMLKIAGFENVIKDDNVYPTISENQISNLDPDYVFLSSEPYSFKDKHLIAIQKQFINTKVVLVDGEFFSWYGSRLQNAPKYFKTLINQIS